MKNFAFIFVSMLCFVFIACASDDDEGCVTVLDCPSGYSCIDSVCRQPVAEQDADVAENTEEVTDSSIELPEENSDTELPGEVDGDSEIPDDITGCPNGCSGFGECDFATGKCTCNEKHGGEDCSECKEGFHWEAVDDDEDGDGAVSCAPNRKCSDKPCGEDATCSTQGNTAVCTCSGNYTGRWCNECNAGFLMNNEGICKPDCTKITCQEPQKCGIDSITNEASCNSCDEFYSGSDCKSCDMDHFCNGHATACVVDGNTPKCTCESNYTGSDCSMCASGYFMSDGVCKKNCDINKCFKTHQCTGTNLLGFEQTTTVTAHGNCNNTTGACDCDPGWITGTSNLGTGETVQCGSLISVFETLNNVECTVCDIDNPPSTYAGSGCPTNCYSNFCNGTDTANGQGTCYTEPETHKIACKCASGYTMTGDSIYYDDNPTGQCE